MRDRCPFADFVEGAVDEIHGHGGVACFGYLLICDLQCRVCCLEDAVFRVSLPLQ